MFPIAALCMVAGEASEPLVSLARATTLLRDSYLLAGDLVVYTSDKLEASMSEREQKIYQDFLNHVSSYRSMVAEFFRRNTFVSVAYNAGTFLLERIVEQYERINSLSGKILDPTVKDFETKFPSSKGFIGHTLLDRLFLAAWFVWLMKAALSLLKTVFIGSRRPEKF